MECSCPSCAISDRLPTQLELAGWIERSVQEERRAVAPGGPSQRTERKRASQWSEVLQSHAQHFTPLNSAPVSLATSIFPGFSLPFPSLAACVSDQVQFQEQKWKQLGRKDKILSSFSASGAGTQNLT